MTIYPGINLEFIRCEDKPFLAGLDRASRMGYQWVEPMVHNGRELLSEAGYFHSVSLDEDPLYIRDLMQQYCLRASGLSSHAPLMRPEISVPWLERAIRFAAAIGTRVVNTDEGIRPPWVAREEALDVIKYTLKTVLRTAERHGCSWRLSRIRRSRRRRRAVVDRQPGGFADAAGELRHGQCVAGRADPYEGLQAVADRAVHVHAKDIDRDGRSVARQVDGHPGGLRVRRWGDQLAQGDGDPEVGELQRGAVGGMRDAGTGRTEPASSEYHPGGLR